MSQFALPLDWPAAEDDGFILGAANRDAVRHLDRPDRWPGRVSLLTGPPRSGRSLLGRIFARASGGALVDDAEDMAEEALFHACNAAAAGAPPLLIVAAAPPPRWRIALPDLASRLAAAPRVAILPPDDALLVALLEKRLVTRGLPATPELLGYVAARIERSYAAIEDMVDALDRAALAGGHRLTLPLVRDVLGDAAVIDDS